MNRNLARFAIGACLVTLPVWGIMAQAANTDMLADAATGSRFLVGESAFRIVPDAIAVSSQSLRSVEASYRATSSSFVPSAGIAQIGDYTVVLPSADQSLRTHLQAASSVTNSRTDSRYSVAVSESTGLPVLVSPTVIVFASPATANAVAQRTGGKVEHASDVAARAVIRYATVDDAIAALPKITADSSVQQASLGIIESFKTPL